jgi:predicted nucleic acid-binding protein
MGNATTGIRVETIKSNPVHLEAVKALGKGHAHLLGLFPGGAFDEHAERGTILIALDSDEYCVGYLLYRVARQRATVVHLCVQESARHGGAGTLLVEHLFSITKHLRGIALKCRRDYAVNKLWPKLGFSVIAETPGRSKAGTLLVHWWRGHAEQTLFSAAVSHLQETKVCAVIDANVLIDLMEDTTPKTLPSKALQADWLEGTLELCVTDEIFNELQRQPDDAERRKGHKFAKTFLCLPSDSAKLAQISGVIRALFPNPASEQDDSDLRQVARAIAAETAFFVTRDRVLLGLREKIEDIFELTILHPTELIVRLDELRRGNEYRPSRFSGTTLRTRLVTDDDLPSLPSIFRTGEEKESAFLARLRCWLAEPNKFAARLLTADEGDPLALTVTSTDPDQLSIHLLRVRRGSAGSTVARQVLRQCLLIALKSGSTFTRFQDDSVQDEIGPALDYFGFFQVSGGWLRIGPLVAETGRALADRLRAYNHPDLEAEGMADFKDLLTNETDVGCLSEYEHLFWPAKITDAAIPTYLVPIKPQWAQELFDERLAAQGLYGRKEELAMNVEGVYYRAAKPSGIEAPARLLWYVSGGKTYEGAMQIRACSRLLQVKIGTPKELYKEFRRLGIYEWKDVYKTARHDVRRNIMALHFDDTELFTKPIALKELRSVMASENHPLQLQSPFKITNELFFKLYRNAVR